MMTITTKDINIENNATTFEIISGGHPLKDSSREKTPP